MIPPEIICIIGNFNPLFIRLLNKELFTKYNSLCITFYGKQYEKINHAKNYLSAMRIIPNSLSLAKYFNSVIKKSICGAMTQKGKKCKNITRGYEKCYLHKKKIINIMNSFRVNTTTESNDSISDKNLPNTMRLKIDPYDGNAYTYKEFVDWYGDNNIWKGSIFYCEYIECYEL